MTRQWTGPEVAAIAERLVPGSVDRSTPVACYLRPEKLVEAMGALQAAGETDFVHLTNLCGVDFWDHFEVVYHVQSFVQNAIACIKADVLDRERPALPSVCPVWRGAWMQECETYDLFGIRFEGHPNLHRILLWDGYPGWPLRKDFLSMPGGLQPGLDEFSGTKRRLPPPVKVVE
ncbi:MAG: NADH-quinone oxidoreductase subunit C [Thermoflexaceae bacterium]|nr:NADH-quinone oxidoreductase subunit C [Thermoflexaceae bacterium]